MTAKISSRTRVMASLVAAPFAVVAGLVTFNVLNRSVAEKPSVPLPSESRTPIDATVPVPMSAPKLTPDQAQACLALTSQLPAKIRDLPARRVSAGAEQNAAYGEPPLTIQCGGPEAAPEPTARIWVISGVCWYAESVNSSTVWQTLDRKVQVNVTIPDAYAASGEASGQWAAEISPVLVATLLSKETRYDCDPA